MSFSSSEVFTNNNGLYNDVIVKNFDVELDSVKDFACTATVTYNGEVRATFTVRASQVGSLSMACFMARLQAIQYIEEQGGTYP